MPMKMGCDGFDLSLLNPTQFKLVFDKIPNTEFFCQSITLPELSLSPVEQKTPFLDLNWQGEKVNHQPLFAEILVDKEMSSYTELYKWIKDMSVLNKAVEGFSDCQVIIGSKTFSFVDVWPMNIGSLNFSIAAADIQPLTFGVTFEYDYFTLS
jgi:hypothetical protein